jgi:hypothetical protein
LPTCYAAAQAKLQRALALLAAGRAADAVEGARPAVELTVRTTFEVTPATENGRKLANWRHVRRLSEL